MDRDQLQAKNQKNRCADSGETPPDASILPEVSGREDNLRRDPAPESGEDSREPADAGPRSAISGGHDAGTGTDETTDGLSETEEAVRQAAEEETGSDDFEKLPVFDRADAVRNII
jgi:hypothetical protein